MGTPPSQIFRAFYRPWFEPSTRTLTTVIDDISGEASRACGRGGSGPAALDFLLQVLRRRFDHRDAASALNELLNFGFPNGTPYAAYYLGFRMVVSGATGSERVLTPGVRLVLEIVRLSVHEQFPRLMPNLYPGELTTCPLLIGSIDAMWLALGVVANSKTSVLEGETLFSSCRRRQFL